MENRKDSSDPLKPATIFTPARIGGVLLTVVVLFFLTIPLVGRLFMPRLETTITERDFESSDECVDFLNHHLPAPLPAAASVSNLEYVSWLDWNLKATIRLPRKAGAEYVLHVQTLELTATTPGRANLSTNYRMRGERSVDGTVSFDPDTEILTVECSNYPHD